MPDYSLDKEAVPERRRVADVHCQTCTELHRLQEEVRCIQEKVASIKVLDHRVTTVESVLAEIKADFEATMKDIHQIQISITETNLARTWAGRIVIALLSAGLTFVAAKYGTPI